MKICDKIVDILIKHFIDDNRRINLVRYSNCKNKIKIKNSPVKTKYSPIEKNTCSNGYV